MSPTASTRAQWSGLGLMTVGIVSAAAALPVELDEAYYWCWSRTLGLSYLDHPPGIAWALALSTKIFGDGRLGLRFFPLLALLLVAVASFASARRLGDPLLALLTLAGAVMVTVGYLPATPDPLQGGLLALGAYAIVRSEDRRWAALAGLLLGLAMIFKHSSALIAIGVPLGFLRTVEGRKRSSAYALGLGLAGLVLAPWLIADLESGGSVVFQGQRVFTAGTSRWLAAPALLLGAMLLTFGPAFAIAQVRQIDSELRHPSDPSRTALASGAFVLLVGCFVAAGLGKGEINWPLPAMIFGLPAVMGYVADHPSRRAIYVGTTAVSGIVGTLVLLHVIHPFLPIAPGQDRTLRSAGYERITEAALALADSSGARTLIARRYQAASMVRYYSRDRLPVLELSTGRPSQFDRWPKPSLCEGETAVLVLNHPGLSEELIGHAELAGETRQIDRGRGDRVVEQWYVTPVRMIDASQCRGRR